MDHIRLIKRAFNISWAYKALWVFGVLLALTTGGGNGGGGGNNGGRVNPSNGQMPDFPRNWPPSWTPQIPNAVAGIVISLICLVLALIVIFTILRYVSNTALIRMVDGYEGAGEKVTVGGGFRLGWSRGAFRSWLAGLLLGLLGLLVVILGILVAAAPQLLWLTRNETLGIIGVVITVGLAFLMILLWIVFFVALGIVSELASRAIVLENLGAIDGIRRGWAMFRARLGDNIIMALILFGIRLVFGVLMIPIFFLLLMVGVATGIIPGLLAGGITNIFAHGATPQTIGLIVGGIILGLVVAIPLLFLGGLWETFHSSTWTLTFRELLASGSTTPAAPIPSEPEAAL